MVLAALAAQKERKSFGSADVAPEILAPELHVLVLPQTAAYDPVPAIVQAVTMTAWNATAGHAPLQPLSTSAATKEHYVLYDVGQGNGAIVASFPMTAVVAGSDIRVVFSHVIRGSSALTNCQECAVPLGVTRIR